MIAVVLAAGAGRRMGGPKAMLAWGNETLLQAALRSAARNGCSAAFAVVRADIGARVTGVERGQLIISSEDDALGPAGSLAAFARSSHFVDSELIAIAPVDLVPDAWDSLPELVRALASQPNAAAARPVCETRRGHPVLVRARVLAEYAMDRAPRPLREVLGELNTQLLDVSVDVLAVTADLDTRDDVARWRALIASPQR